MYGQVHQERRITRRFHSETVVSTRDAFTGMVNNNITTGNTSVSSYDFAVIPQEIGGAGKTVTVSFDVWVQDNSGNDIIGTKDGAGVNVSATLPAYTWEKGNRYNYTVTIKGENVNLFPIEFGTPNVTGITDANFDGSDEVVLPTN